MKDRPTVAKLIELCGLSHAEAAEFLNVHIGTVRKWSAGQRQVDRDNLDKLADLWLAISSIDEPETALPEGAQSRREIVLATRDRSRLVKMAGLTGLRSVPKWVRAEEDDEPLD